MPKRSTVDRQARAVCVELGRGPGPGRCNGGWMVAPIADRPRFGRFTVIQGAAMAEKVVDVVLRDRLVASYPVVLNRLKCGDIGAGFHWASQGFHAGERLYGRGHSRSKVQRQKCPGITPQRGAEFSGAIKGTPWPTWCGVRPTTRALAKTDSILLSSRARRTPLMVYGRRSALSRVLYAGTKVLFCSPLTLGS